MIVALCPPRGVTTPSPRRVARRWLDAAKPRCRVKIPSLDELARYCDDKYCYDIANALEMDFKDHQLRFTGGAYIRDDGTYADHCWVVAPDGTIIDTTHAQFDRRVPILIAPPGDPMQKHYLDARDMTAEERELTFGPM